MNSLNFTFSDLISGYVESYDQKSKIIILSTSDDRKYTAELTGNTYSKLTQNLNEEWQDRGSKLNDLLVPGQLIFLYGTFFPEETTRFEVNYIIFSGENKTDHRYSEQ